jgi:hypothetical protein
MPQGPSAAAGEEIPAETVKPSAQNSPPLHWSGVIDTLDDKQGIDLDRGVTTDQNAPGVDISFYGQTSHIGAMAQPVQYTVLPDRAKTEHHECAGAANWTRLYSDVYSLAAGRAICVKTSEGRFSMLIIEKPATNATGVIGFRYFTWK